MTPRGVDFDPNDPVIRALRALPDARAPKTLAPRVMAAVRARLAAPPPRTWFEWAPMWRIASVVGAVGVVAALVVFGPGLLGSVEGWSVESSGSLARRFDGVRTAWEVSGVVFRAVWPLVASMVAVITVLTVVCVTLGAAVGRVALGGTLR